MTHSSFMIALHAKKGDAISKHLIDCSSIGCVVVDESSQLWDGHVPALLRTLAPQTHVVLVGDDMQLPPFGSTEVLRASTDARSLFDAAASAAPAVPVTQLDTSYRLPRAIAEVLSHALYGGALGVARNSSRDEVVRERLGIGARTALHDGTRDNFARAVLDLTLLAPERERRPLLWLHVPGKRGVVEKSSVNHAEARVTAALVSALLRAVRAGDAALGINGGYEVDHMEAWKGVQAEEEGDEGGVDFARAVKARDVDGTHQEEGEGVDGEEGDESGDGEGEDGALDCGDENANVDVGGGFTVSFAEPLVSTLTSAYNILIGGMKSDSSAAEKAANEAAAAAARASDAETARAVAAAVTECRNREARVASGRARIRVCAITPYEAQRKTIEEITGDALDSVTGGDDFSQWLRASRTVGNVDSLQGQEADVCVVSAVLSPGAGGGLGFLADNRRVNVMLSRSQQLLVIVGNAEAWVDARGTLLGAFAARAFADGAVFQAKPAVAEKLYAGAALLPKSPRCAAVPVDGAVGGFLERLAPPLDRNCSLAWREALAVVAPAVTVAPRVHEALPAPPSTSQVPSQSYREPPPAPRPTSSVLRPPNHPRPCPRPPPPPPCCEMAPLLGDALRRAVHSLARLTSDGWVSGNKLGLLFPCSKWQYRTLTRACEDAGLCVQYPTQCQWQVCLDDDDSVSDSESSDSSVMNLGEALRHMVDFFAPRGEWINGHTLYTHFPKDEWGYSSLRKECAYAGLSVQDVHSNLWFVCTPPNAHIALRRVV